jgi:predicted amidohydrolase YtcJ
LPATLVLHNARVITMDAARLRAEAVAAEGERILAVGSDGDARAHVGPQTEVIDCGGGAVLPGFIDGHCHLLAYAASLLSVDCSPATASSIGDIQEAIRRRAQETLAGRWIRAVGYSEIDLTEERHPTRGDLDAAASDHPVRLIHRSGHACVLNSLALRLCGIDIATEQPPGGYLERDTTSGEPTGLLLEMNELVERAVPPLSYEELAEGVRLASASFLAAGVTSLVDAAHTNGPTEWELMGRLRREGHLALRVTAMVGIDHLAEGQEWRSDAQDEWMGLGAAKIVIKELGDKIFPAEADLAGLVAEAHDRGCQVAVHAVEERAVAAAVAAYEAALSRRRRGDHRHRIEHCGICPPDLARRIGAAGVLVVTQPSFLYYNGERYLRQVPPEKHALLYPLRSLLAAGVRLGAGSDCPVVAPDVIAGLYGAVTRRSAAGRPLSGAEAVRVEEALAMYTTGAAFSSFAEGERGSISPGRQADLVVLSGDPTACPPAELLALRPEMTVVGGRVAWSTVKG